MLLGRYLKLLMALKQRTHAQRSALRIEDNEVARNTPSDETDGGNELSVKLSSLSLAQKKQFHQAMDRLRRQKPVDDLDEILRPILKSPL